MVETTEKQKERFRRYHQENREKIAERHRQYNKQHKEEISANKGQYYLSNKEAMGGKWLRASKSYNRRLKELVISHYSLDSNSCAFCGFGDLRALSIDHINGGGGKHRKEVGNFYAWLKRNNFPEGYQVLCMNCQFIKRVEKREHRWQ